MILQKLVGNIYSVIMEVVLWLIPIIGAVAGIILTRELWLFGGNAFLGFIIGLIAGLILDLLFFGPVIILMNIRSSLKNMENK